MPHARTLTCIAAFLKLSARGGSPFVNAASGFFADFATQSAAAWGRIVGATHAAHRGCEFLAQACGHHAALRVHFFHAEVHPKTGAAGAAAGAS